MNENEMILKMKDGTERKYEIVLSYLSLKNNNRYIVFTDNVADIDGKTNLYAKRYNLLTHKLEDIIDEDEWKEVQQNIDEYVISNGDKHVIS